MATCYNLDSPKMTVSNCLDQFGLWEHLGGGAVFIVNWYKKRQLGPLWVAPFPQAKGS